MSRLNFLSKLPVGICCAALMLGGGRGGAQTAPEPPVPGQAEVAGHLLREVWLNVSGNEIYHLLSGTNHLSKPASEVVLQAGACSPINRANNYGQRLRGYITIPETGEYQFYIVSDDRAQLWVGGDGTKWSRERIASCLFAANAGEWTRFAGQESAMLSLEAGQKLYVEILHKEASGGDVVQMGWKRPGAGAPEQVPADYLSSYTYDPNDQDDDGLPDDWEAQHGLSSADNGSGDSRNGWAGVNNAAGMANWACWKAGVSPFDAAERAEVPGSFLREVWTGIKGDQVTELVRRSDNFRQAPNSVDYTEGAVALRDWADNYGQRLRGYVTVPQAGTYRFYVAGDNQCDVWVSEDGTKWGRELAIRLRNHSSYGNWTQYGAQQSREYTLAAGQKLYVEILHKEGAGNDCVQLGWTIPGNGAPEQVPDGCISSYGLDANDQDDDGLPDDWELLHGIDYGDNGSGAAKNGWDGVLNGAGLTNGHCWEQGLNPYEPDLGTVWGRVSLAGSLSREVWTGIERYWVSELVRLTDDFLAAPAARGYTTGALSPQNWGDNYGQRLRGYVTIPQDGKYRFYAAGDDHYQVWVSGDGTKWNKQKAIDCRQWSTAGQWTKYAEQKSVEHTFSAGQVVYVEILHKEKSGNDFVQLGWTTPGETSPVEIPRVYLSSYVFEADDQDDDDLPDAWEVSHGLSATDNGQADAKQGKHGINNRKGLTNHQCWRLGLDPKSPDLTALAGAVSVEGVLLREVWTGIEGGSADRLIGSARFAEAPDEVTFARPDCLGLRDWGNNYGQRWRGWLTVPSTGAYEIRISSDDSSALYLSTDASPKHKKVVAHQSGYAANLWEIKRTEQTSTPLQLEAGKRYYVEVIHKEGSVADHCELAWMEPGKDYFEPVPAERVSAWVDDAETAPLGYARAWFDGTGAYAHFAGGLAAQPAAEQLPGADPDGDGLPNWEEYRLGTDPLTANTAPVEGALVRHLWWNAGSFIHDSLDRFLTAPDVVETVLHGDDFTKRMGDKYIERTRGYLKVPQTGNYVLALASDDDGELHLSTDASIGGAKKVIHVGSATTFDNWDRIEQYSGPLYLEAGQRYYLEIRHHESAGNDFVRLAWLRPGETALEFIPGGAFETFVADPDDPYGFGYPAAWLAGSGLNQLSLAEQAPWVDADGDGLTNWEEYLLGTNPLSDDTDGDGIGDYEEVKLARTNPAVADFDGSRTVLVTRHGADYTASTGAWQKSGNSTYAAGIRGSLSYAFNLAADTATALRLNLAGGQYLEASKANEFVLDVYVDDVYQGRTVLRIETGATALWLPPLDAGAHTLKVAWLNGDVGTSLRLDQLSLEAWSGPDSNNDGIPDWMDYRAGQLSILDETPVESYTSPYCLEGGAQDTAALTLVSSYAPAADATDVYSIFIREHFYLDPSASRLAPLPALRGRYYADAPLSPDGTATTVSVADAGTGAHKQKTVTWLAYDLHTQPAEVLYVRRGDALLLTTSDPEGGTLTVADPALNAETFLISAGETAPVVFITAGTYTLAYGEREVAVRVSYADLEPAPSLLKSISRLWSPTWLPQEAVLSQDDDLMLWEDSVSAAGSRTLRMLTQSGVEQHLVARLGEHGPILASAPVHTLVYYGSGKTTWDIVSSYPDGSELWRGQISLGGLLNGNLRIVIEAFQAGVVFLDGSIRMELTAADLDADGFFTYYILRPPGHGGAPCHNVLIYDGDALLTSTDI